ncbi:hypothetical protein A7P61_21585 [Pantoea agglomerans pv. betae]|nr:hypothetical protein [Pantoea agglomerans]WHU86194.1 hypothetical protein A7P61_21585 [Pantoea agglomerans pv. betae]
MGTGGTSGSRQCISGKLSGSAELSSAASLLSQQNNGSTTGTTQQNGGMSLSSITSMQPGLNQRGPLG